MKLQKDSNNNSFNVERRVGTDDKRRENKREENGREERQGKI